MSGGENKTPRAIDGCPDRGDCFNCKLSHVLEVRLSTLETKVKHLTGTYDPLLPLFDRMRDDVFHVAEVSNNSKSHVNSLLERVHKLEEHTTGMAISVNNIKNTLGGFNKSTKYHAENISKLINEHQEIMKTLQNEEVCRRLSAADISNIKSDNDELYAKYSELEKSFHALSTEVKIESNTRVTSEATSRRLLAGTAGAVTLICTVISVIVAVAFR